MRANVVILTLIAVLSLVATGHADWTCIGPAGGPIYSATVTSSSPPVLYVASTNTNFPLYRTTDNGATWAQYGASLPNYPRMMAAHPTNPDVIYGLVGSTFYRTTNGGVNWYQASLGSNTNGNDIAVNPLNPDVIYVVCYKYDGSAWKPTSAKSTNGGLTWVTTQIDTASTSTMYSAAIDPIDTTIVYMGGSFGNVTAVFKSTDCGATWSQCPSPGAYYYAYSLLVSPTDHNTIFAGTLYGICRSTDAGQTWTRQSTNNYNYRIATAPDNPNIMYSASYSYLYRSTDGGLTWANSSTGLTGKSIRTVVPIPGVPGLVFCGSTAGMFRSTDYGATWTPVNNGILLGKIPALALQEPSTIWIEFVDNDIFKSTDDGATWTQANTPLSCGNVCNIVFDPTNPQRIWMLEGSG